MFHTIRNVISRSALSSSAKRGLPRQQHHNFNSALSAWQYQTRSLGSTNASDDQNPAADTAKSVGVGGAVFGDPRNKEIVIYMNSPINTATAGTSGRFVRRADAQVSVFDSAFLLGDAVWEGLRLYNGQWFCLDAHLARLYEACKYMDINIQISPKQLKVDLDELVKRNGMVNSCHARLMVSRGEKMTPYQGPKVNLGPPTIVCIAEFKPASAAGPVKGLRLRTSHVRRGYPDVQDQKLNSHSKINCVTACITAAKADADEALMLDPTGIVATCNSTHFFIVYKGEVWTSKGTFCIPGITRSNVLQLCRDNGIPAYEKDFSLYEVYGASEVFVTGTFAGVTPVSWVDGREVGTDLFDTWGEEQSLPGPITQRIQQLYKEKIIKECGGM